MHALERLILAAKCRTDLLAQMMAIAFHEIILLYLRHVAFHDRTARSILQDRDDVLMLDAAIFREEFQAIAIIGQMAGRNHDRTIHFRLGEYDGHEHRRRRRHAAVNRHNTGCRQCMQHGFFQLMTGQAGVTTHRNTQIFLGLTCTLSQERNESRCNHICSISAQVHRFISNALHSDTTNITAIGKFHQVLLRNNHYYAPSANYL